jgi:hypothetical protein
MRSLVTCVLAWALHFGLVPGHAQAEDASAVDTDPRCQALQSAALANDLPLEFLTRLIWQESRFNDFAISRAGAQGIAQFMPATAVGVQKTYASVLGSHEPLVLRSSARRNGSWYRVRIGADTHNDAERVCSSLRAVGGNAAGGGYAVEGASRWRGA